MAVECGDIDEMPSKKLTRIECLKLFMKCNFKEQRELVILYIRKLYFKIAYNKFYLRRTIPKITKKHDDGDLMNGFSRLVYMKNQLDTGHGVLKRIKEEK